VAAAARDLMARTGHDSEHAAIIYQHVTRGADEVITAAMPEPLTALTRDTECTTSDRDEHSGTRANGPPMARVRWLWAAQKPTRRSATWHSRRRTG
jgi:hypothetical protein